MNWTAIIPFICDLAYIFNKNCSASCTYQSRKVQCFSDLSILLRLIYFVNIVPIAAVLGCTSTNVPTHNPMPFFSIEVWIPTVSPVPACSTNLFSYSFYSSLHPSCGRLRTCLHQISLSFCLISCTSQRQYRHHAPCSVRHQCLARYPLDGWIWSHR